MTGCDLPPTYFIVLHMSFLSLIRQLPPSRLFFFNDTAPPEISPLPLHDALPISPACGVRRPRPVPARWPRPPADHGASACAEPPPAAAPGRARGRAARGAGAARATRSRDSADRKSTRLNSSHQIISYAVFFLKKK